MCARCSSSFLVSDSGVRHWLLGKCPNLGKSSDRPVLLPYEALHVGNKVSHHSHSLKLFRGVVYCGVCGARGPTKLHKLAHPCLPPTSKGKATLKALNQGHLPPGLVSWPTDTNPRSTPSESLGRTLIEGAAEGLDAAEELALLRVARQVNQILLCDTSVEHTPVLQPILNHTVDPVAQGGFVSDESD